MSYVCKLVVSIDQLYNTICGGDPDITISARVGYFSNHTSWKAKPRKLKKNYWKTTEKLIDWTYEPVDGPKHCYKAYLENPDDDYTANNWWPFLIIMSLIIIIICSVVGPILNFWEFLKSTFGKILQSIIDKIYAKEKNRLEKWIKKIFLIIIALIIIPIYIVVAVVVVVGLIILMNLPLILIPLGIVVRVIKSVAGVIKRFNKGKASQSNNKIYAKEKNRLKKGIKKFKKILNEYCLEGIKEFDVATIIMDMLRELFGYHKYSEITSNYDIKKTSCVLTVKINNRPEFLIMVYPIKFDLKTVSNIQVADYGPNQSVNRVILTNGITWKMFTINREQELNEPVTFDFLSLDPEKPEDIELLYNLSKESLDKSINQDHRAKAGIK